jgi:hypothetical protein
VILVILVPRLLAFNPLPGSQPHGSGPGGGGGWPLQITPAAALSVQQAVPQFHQLSAVYGAAGFAGSRFSDTELMHQRWSVGTS